MQAEAHLLRHRPALLFQQAANQADATSPAIVAREQRQPGRAPRPWLNWLNKAQGTNPCLMTFAGHSTAVTGCEFAPDGQRVISISDRGIVRICDARSGQELAVLGEAPAQAPPHPDLLRVSPNGARIMTSSLNGSITLWDAHTAALVTRVLAHPDGVLDCAFSPDSTRIVSGGRDNKLRLRDGSTGRPLAARDVGGFVVRCRFARNGTRIIADGKAWDVDTLNELGPAPWRVESPDGGRLLAGGWKSPVGGQSFALELLDGHTLERIAYLAGHRYTVEAAAFSPDGARIVSRANSENVLRLWNGVTGQLVATLSGHSGTVKDAAFSPDGRRLASASQDATLAIWDAQHGERLMVLAGHAGPVVNCTFSPDGTRLASASRDGTVKVWEATAAWHDTTTRHRAQVTACAFSSTGARVASASEDHTLKLWGGEDGHEIDSLTGHTGPVRDCAFSPDGARLLSVAHRKSGSSKFGEVKIWALDTRRELLALEGHAGPGTACRFHPDGVLVVTASETWLPWDAVNNKRWPNDLRGRELTETVRAYASSDLTLRIWNSETGAQVAAVPAHLGGVKLLAMSLDGRRIVSAGLSQIGTWLELGGQHKTIDPRFCELKVWDSRSCSHIATLSGHRGQLTTCVFTPDDTAIVSASEDGTIRVWHPESAENLLTLASHSTAVRTCDVSPDSRTLASGGDDRTLRLWSLPSGRELAVIRGGESPVRACRFSPDGRLIAAADAHAVTIWGLTGRYVGEFRTDARATAIAWSPDGRRIAVGYSAGAVIVLQLEALPA